MSVTKVTLTGSVRKSMSELIPSALIKTFLTAENQYRKKTVDSRTTNGADLLQQFKFVSKKNYLLAYWQK